MKRALILMLSISLVTGSLAGPAHARKKGKAPKKIKRDAGPRRVNCPSRARHVKAGDNLQKKLDSAGRNASICFKPGIYRLRHAIHPRDGQVLIFRRGAVLNGSKVVTNWSKDGSHWVAGDQSQRFTVPTMMTEHMCDNSSHACIYEDVFFEGKPLRHVTSRSRLGPGRVYFDKNTSKIYIARNPQGHTIEATVGDAAIMSKAARVTVAGATIEKFAHDGIDVTASNWTITDSDIRRIHFHAIDLHGGAGHVLRNNRLHHNGVIGMTAVSVRDLTVKRNKFDHNNYLHAGPLAAGWHEGGVKILKAHHVGFRKNWIHHNYGDGLWFDWNNSRIDIAKNLIEANTRNGLHYEASFDAKVRRNIIRNNGTVWAAQGKGIYNSTSKNVTYQGNRIEGNVIRSIVISWQDRGRSEKFGERRSANLLFRNNRIVLHKNFQSWVGVYWDQDPRIFKSNNRFQNNTYVAPRHSERKGKRWWRWDGKDLTWSEWRARGFDVKGTLRKGRKKVVGRTPPRMAEREFFLRDTDGCVTNQNYLRPRKGENKVCREIDQAANQVWAAKNGIPLKLDTSRRLTGRVTTTSADCASGASTLPPLPLHNSSAAATSPCSPVEIGVGEVRLDVTVVGTVAGKKRNLGAYTHTFLTAPGEVNTSRVSIKLDQALANARVHGLKILTKLHGAALGHRVVVLNDPASWIQVPIFVLR
jgi:hypothetical protein